MIPGQTRRSRPAAHGPAPETSQATHDVPASVQQEPASFDLLWATPVERRTFWTGWSSGYWHGTTDGAAAAEWDMANAWSPVAAWVKGLGAPGNRTHEQLTSTRSTVEARGREDVAWRCTSREQLIAACLASWGEAA